MGASLSGMLLEDLQHRFVDIAPEGLEYRRLGVGMAHDLGKTQSTGFGDLRHADLAPAHAFGQAKCGLADFQLCGQGVHHGPALPQRFSARKLARSLLRFPQSLLQQGHHAVPAHQHLERGMCRALRRGDVLAETSRREARFAS